jgi:predicted acetyltransferase
MDLARRAFGPFGDQERDSRLASARLSVAAGRHFGAFSGGRLLGSARFFDMTQWWQGRPLPMAGVAGVKVAPEARGAGVGRALMTALVREIAARGYPLSALYPSTAAIYRSLGYEMAGGLYQASIPARSLRSLQPPDVARAGGAPALRRAGPDDAAEINAVVARVHETARACGPVNFDLDDTRQALGDEEVFCYLADDGFLAYSWSGGHSEIQVYSAVAGSAGTARALWSILASHDSMAGTVRARVSPADPVSWLSREPEVGLTRLYQWMLRVVDAAAAIAGREFPAAAQAAVALRINDDVLPVNAGLWRLSVGGGKGELSRYETDGPARRQPADPLVLGPRGFAALYAGTPVGTLRLVGLAAGGDPAADASLDSAFAGTAYMLDYF